MQKKQANPLETIKQQINEATISPASEALPALDCVFDPEGRTLDLTQPPIHIEYDLNPLRQLRDAAAADPSQVQTQAIKEQMTYAFSQIMHGSVNALAEQCKTCRQIKQFQTDWTNIPEKLLLCVTEIGEAMEAYRKLTPSFRDKMQRKAYVDPQDPCMPALHNFAEEIADTLIRLLDLTASLTIDIEAAIAHKMAINELRPVKHNKHC